MNTAAALAAARNEQDLLVEMVRMCVAEAGYDPQAIQPYSGPAPGFVFTNVGHVVPHEVCWRARELVGIGEPKCAECARRDRDGILHRRCGATRRLVLDCANEEQSGSV